jgi:hypothetical protein
MINSELDHVTSVEQFNDEIRKQQEEAHGADYCSIHDAIRMYMKKCDSYMELGTHQGGTASTALLCKPSTIVLVDKDMSRYKKVLEKLAKDYCIENNISFSAIEDDSTSNTVKHNVDMLVIDSYHHANHMKKELDVHGNNTNKYIIAHDTSVINGKPNDSLYVCLKTFADLNGWKVIERGTTNVGYTVIQKI